eukprot:TRINITY_DN17434_c0_g1_i1.p1 TRINITY_DN17434_c0_g1~~TRINITY_DN17434_c0_g1_i1.p1  ORF type:complete len:154 (-),score=54.08 TRINITY_DN17434_c0_g1_i1:20-481(-)
MIRRPPRSPQSRSSAASDVYKRQGLEGAQAELASDFAIPKFRHLKRLMVVHGRHCLYRDAGTVQFSLLKSLLLVTILIIYATRSGFSGQALFTSWLLAALNALFVQIQALAIGIIDKDIDDVVLECFPQLYPCLLYTSPSPRDRTRSRMPSSA